MKAREEVYTSKSTPQSGSDAYEFVEDQSARQKPRSPPKPVAAPVGSDGYTDLGLLNENAERDESDNLKYDDFVGKEKKTSSDGHEAPDLLKKYARESKQKYGKKHKHANKALVLAPVNATLMPGMLQLKPDCAGGSGTSMMQQPVFSNGTLGRQH